MSTKRKPETRKGQAPRAVAPAAPRGRAAFWWQPLGVGLLALLCFVQTQGYAFVYDDKVQIVLNPRIRDFSNLGTAFTENFWAFNSPHAFTNYYRPMQTVAFMLGYSFGALSPAPYHWINILLHVAAALAVFWVGRRLFPSGTAAFWGALLFAAHPMHTESVAWIAGVTDVGCGLFYFAALGCYLRFWTGKDPDRRWLALSAAAFAAALFFKEMAFTLPLVILLMDWAVAGERGGWVPRLLRLSPFAAVFLVYLLLRWNALGTFAHTSIPLPIGIGDRFLTMLHFVGRYLCDLLIPFRQNAFHVFWPFSRLPAAEIVVSFVLLLLYAAALYSFWRRREPKLLFLALFTTLTLLPVLYLGGVGQNMYTERYLYIPSLGYCLALAAVAERRLQGGAVRTGLLTALAGTLAFLTLQRNPVWRDNKNFYVETLRVSPDAALLHNDLGKIYFEERDIPAARRQFEAALAAEARAFVSFPRDRAGSLLGLSAVANAEGRLEEAWNYAQQARELVPSLADSYGTLGMIRARQERYDEAAALLLRALELQPNNVAARVNLGGMLMMQGKLSEAEKELSAALELEPDSAGGRTAMAYLYSRTNRLPQALQLLRDVLAANPSYDRARTLLSELTAPAPR